MPTQKKKTTTRRNATRRTSSTPTKKKPAKTRAALRGRPRTKTGISVALSHGLLDAVTEYAASLGISRSQFIESCLEDAMSRADLTVHAMTNDAIRKAFLEAFTKPGVMAEMTRMLGTQLTDDQSQMVLDFLRSSEKQPPPK